MSEREVIQSTVHDLLAGFEHALESYPLETWITEWIHAYAYLCNCDTCQFILQSGNVDVVLITEILHSASRV